ncbi:hypothetical protein Avbf_00572 [Armadillidium vulgare]|nr:hypothetical protein Avbf_00572 [Armadillidium vulgare]
MTIKVLKSKLKLNIPRVLKYSKILHIPYRLSEVSVSNLQISVKYTVIMASDTVSLITKCANNLLSTKGCLLSELGTASNLSKLIGKCMLNDTLSFGKILELFNK